MSGHCCEYDTVTLIEFSGGGGQSYGGKLRQKSAVEREPLWGIAKLKVDWGHAIDVCEVAVGGGSGDGFPKGLECVLGGTSFTFYCIAYLV